MSKVQRNQVCKICERNGKPNAYVDIEWLEEKNPLTGKNKNKFWERNTDLKVFHVHKEKDIPNPATRPLDVPRLERSEEVAVLFKRLSDAEQEIRAIKTQLNSLAF